MVQNIFLTIVDDFTRGTWTILMASNDEVTNNITQFFYMLENQFKTSVKILRSDNGSEFLNTKLREFLLGRGCIHQTSCLYTPQ